MRPLTSRLPLSSLQSLLLIEQTMAKEGWTGGKGGLVGDAVGGLVAEEGGVVGLGLAEEAAGRAALGGLGAAERCEHVDELGTAARRRLHKFHPQ